MITEKTKDNSILNSYLVDRRSLIDSYLLKIAGSQENIPPTLYESMRYSLAAGGKRLRPILTIASCEAVGGMMENAIPAAIAIEMIHTYSLIHDDLPAMDNDDLRRGKPTNHKVYGEATAILAGDGLLTMAFSILSDLTKEHESQRDRNVPPIGDRRGFLTPSWAFPGNTMGSQSRLSIIHEIARAAGPEGMVGGQQMDMENEGKNLDVKALEELHRRKTGALILAAVRSGGIAGDATEMQLQALTSYGTKIGIAFQIADDVLDVEGDVEDVGKSIGKDAKQMKNTYPAIMGVAESKVLARQLSSDAISALHSMDERANPLRMIAEYIVERKS